MDNQIFISQELVIVENGVYDVEMTVDDEVETYEYNDCNMIYPFFNSLTKVIKEMDDGANIQLETSDKRFAKEIAGHPNQNSRMLEILNEVKNRKNITINAY